MRAADFLDKRLRVNLLLNVDRHGRDFERIAVLRVLPFPDQLRVEGWIAGIEDCFRLALVIGCELAELAWGYLSGGPCA